jgi:hypothetical protein
MSIAIVNASTGLPDEYGALIVTALNRVLPNFCNDWEIKEHTAVYVPMGQTTTIPLKVFILDIANNQGALLRHDLSSGVPYGKCFIKTLLKYGVPLYSADFNVPTFAQAVSQEVFDLLVDPLCNSWSHVGDKQSMFAYETCSPVQGSPIVVDILLIPARRIYNTVTHKYDTTPAVVAKVGLSDWVLPAWFDFQNVKGPFNHLNTLKQSFTVDRLGYAIQMVAGTSKQTLSMHFGSDVTDEQRKRYTTKPRIQTRFMSP